MEYVRIPNELQHHGIKGMHWGERRYQNPDGSYTAEGRVRYNVGTEYTNLRSDRKGVTANRDISNGRVKNSRSKKSENSQELTRKQKNAKKVYDRIQSVRDDTDRMAKMNRRQLKSLDKAESYWKDVSEGKKPTEKRNFIKREADRHRSLNKVQRAGKVAAVQVIGTASGMAYSVAVQKKTYGGRIFRPDPVKIATDIASGTAGSILVSEFIDNRLLGHF